MIQSKLHKAIETAPPGPHRRAFEAAAELPHYILSEDVHQLIMGIGPTVEQLVGDLVGRNSLALPFPVVLVEHEIDGDETQWVRVEQNDASSFSTQFYILRGDTSASIGGKTDVRFDEEGKSSLSRDSWAAPEETDLRGLHNLVQFSAAMMIEFLLAMHIRGVARDVTPAPKNLNKARAKKGKPPIPEFTVLRVGHVYDRDGKAHAVGTGRKMPIHMRAGHSRRQHYGRGNELIKTIYVPPTIVNFDPNAEVKMPKRILKA